METRRHMNDIEGSKNVKLIRFPTFPTHTHTHTRKRLEESGRGTEMAFSQMILQNVIN